MGCSQSCETLQPSNFNDNDRSKNKNFNYRRRSIDVPEQIFQKIQIINQQLNQQQLNFAQETLAQHELFNSLKEHELKSICQEMICATAQPQKYIFNQGDIGNCFFIIYKGSVQVQIGKKIVRTLKQGNTFGELALLFKCARTASIICREKNCKFLIMRPSLYRKTLQKMRLSEYSRNVKTVQKVPMFTCLTNKQKFALSTTIKQIVFNEGDTIFTYGDDSQSMYIISEGKVIITIKDKKDIILSEGQIFGQASLQQNITRSGTAKAMTKTICSIMSRKDVEDTLGSSLNNILFYNLKKWALLRSNVFKNFQQSDLNKFIIQFQHFQVKDGQYIDAKRYEGFIICFKGKINQEDQGKLFNEDSWQNKSYKCEKLLKSEDGYCGFLSFKKVLDIIEQITAREIQRKNLRKVSQRLKNKFNLADFLHLKKLGQGQFGQVYLVKHTHYGTNLFAIKCLSKQIIKKQDLLQTVIQQKRILEKAVFPYIVGYVQAFHDSKHIFLLMEYIRGKQMFDVIREVKNMPITMVKYYFASLVLSIQYLHSNSIVYRDIKPQNSVVDHKGKIFLIDMGTAKQLTADNFFKSFTIIGTPHYMAPEIFQGKGYSFEVDLWSLGCLLYQFLCYTVPFGENIDDPFAIYNSVKKTNLSFPKFVKDEKAKQLIKRLLIKKPKQRNTLTFQKIKQCQFFKDFDWKKLSNEEFQAPYIPKQFQNAKQIDVDQFEAKNFLRTFYKSENILKVSEWNETI